jgi:hypothetical protein
VAHRGRENADAPLIAALAGGATVQDAAEVAGVAPRTVHRRLEDPAFRQSVANARTELIARAVGSLAESASEAASTLRALLGAETPPAVRLGAARSVLDLVVKLREHDELAERIAALEGRLAEAPKGGTPAWPRRTG